MSLTLKTANVTLTIVECVQNGRSEPETLKLDTAVGTLLKIAMCIRNGYLSYKWCYENLSRAKGEVNKVAYSNIYPTRCNFTQFILSGNCSTCFGWYIHPSSVAQTTVSTASGNCHTVTAICCYRGRGGTGLNVLWVACATVP